MLRSLPFRCRRRWLVAAAAAVALVVLASFPTLAPHRGPAVAAAPPCEAAAAPGPDGGLRAGFCPLGPGPGSPHEGARAHDPE